MVPVTTIRTKAIVNIVWTDLSKLSRNINQIIHKNNHGK